MVLIIFVKLGYFVMFKFENGKILKAHGSPCKSCFVSENGFKRFSVKCFVKIEMDICCLVGHNKM